MNERKPSEITKRESKMTTLNVRPLPLFVVMFVVSFAGFSILSMFSVHKLEDTEETYRDQMRRCYLDDSCLLDVHQLSEIREWVELQNKEQEDDCKKAGLHEG